MRFYKPILCASLVSDNFTAIYAVNFRLIKLMQGVHVNQPLSFEEYPAKNARGEFLKALLPYGMLATKKWLMANGLTTHTLDNAVKSEKLLRLTNGVYSQYSRSLRWEGVVASLQRMEAADSESMPAVVVGGLTALSLSGLSQYLAFGQCPRVHLYAAGPLPTWLTRLSLPIDFVAHRTIQLWPDDVMENIAFHHEHVWDIERPPVWFSCPEKAIFEVLADVPSRVSFEHADELMQGLITVSPTKIDTLLKACRNIKVKRLFLWFAKRQGYAWVNQLNDGNYDLGSGKRLIAKGGTYSSDYLITVPTQMMSADDEGIE